MAGVLRPRHIWERANSKNVSSGNVGVQRTQDPTLQRQREPSPWAPRLPVPRGRPGMRGFQTSLCQHGVSMQAWQPHHGAFSVGSENWHSELCSSPGGF